MAHFDHQILEHLKKLCRMELSEEEQAVFSQNLKRVLEYVDLLNEVDTDNVQPCRYVLRDMLQNRMREDVERDLLSRDKFLANAPDQIGGMIRTPPVLKSEN